MAAITGLGISSADELLAPVRETFAKLQRSSALERGDVEEALRQLNEAAAQALRVTRVGIWRFSEDRTQIRCLDLFDRRSGEHASGATISAADAPTYFAALARELTIAAGDAR